MASIAKVCAAADHGADRDAQLAKGKVEATMLERTDAEVVQACFCVEIREASNSNANHNPQKRFYLLL